MNQQLGRALPFGTFRPRVPGPSICAGTVWQTRASWSSTLNSSLSWTSRPTRPGISAHSPSVMAPRGRFEDTTLTPKGHRRLLGFAV